MSDNRIDLTLSQCRQIVKNIEEGCTSFSNFREFCDMLNNQPDFMDEGGMGLGSVGEIMGVAQHGCDSYAHAACFYHKAEECFKEYSHSVETYLEDLDLFSGDNPLTWDVKNEWYAGFLSKILCICVEDYTQKLSEALEGVEY